MGSKPLLHPAPSYRTLETHRDNDEDASGPRCGHTLTAVSATKSHGLRLILFGGATAIDGGLAGVTNSVHSYDVLTRKWTRIKPAGEPPSPWAAHVAAAVGTMVLFQGKDLGLAMAMSWTWLLRDILLRSAEMMGKELYLMLGLWILLKNLMCGRGRIQKVIDLLQECMQLLVPALMECFCCVVEETLLDQYDQPYSFHQIIPLADAYGLLMHRNGQWEWTLAHGVSPSPSYQHAAVFVGEAAIAVSCSCFDSTGHCCWGLAGQKWHCILLVHK